MCVHTRTYIFSWNRGRPSNVSPDGKRLVPPMDTRNMNDDYALMNLISLPAPPNPLVCPLQAVTENRHIVQFSGTKYMTFSLISTQIIYISNIDLT